MWKSNRRQHKRKLAIHLKVSYCPVLAKPNLHATQNYLKLAQFGWDWLRLAQLCVKKVRLHHITGFSPTELRWVRCELCLLSTSTVVRWRAGQAGHSVRTAAVLSNIEHQHQHREQCLHRLSISNSRVWSPDTHTRETHSSRLSGYVFCTNTKLNQFAFLHFDSSSWVCRMQIECQLRKIEHKSLIIASCVNRKKSIGHPNVSLQMPIENIKNWLAHP